MAKATITFDLDNPDDLMQWKQCVHASTMAVVIFELQYNFMRKIESELDSGKDPYEAVRETLHETLSPINEIGDEIIS